MFQAVIKALPSLLTLIRLQRHLVIVNLISKNVYVQKATIANLFRSYGCYAQDFQYSFKRRQLTTQLYKKNHLIPTLECDGYDLSEHAHADEYLINLS